MGQDAGQSAAGIYFSPVFIFFLFLSPVYSSVSLANAASKLLVASPAHLLVVVPLLDELVYYFLHLSVTFHLQIFYEGIKSP